MTEEIAAVPSADSAPYLGGGHVSDEEFDSWVKRSQDQADAVMADWDGSVEFERRELEPDPPPMEVDDQTDPPGVNAYGQPNRTGPIPWQAIADRIRAGEVIGPEARQEIAGEMADPPQCGPDCWCRGDPDGGSNPPTPIGADTISALSARYLQGPGMPQWAYAQALLANEPGRRVAMSMPRRQGRSAVAEWFQAEGYSAAAHGFREAAQRARKVRGARRRLETLGFVVVDAEAVPRSSGLVLPSDDAVAWARRTFAVPTQREIVPPDNVYLSPYSYFYLNDPVTFGQAQRRATFTQLEQ